MAWTLVLMMAKRQRITKVSVFWDMMLCAFVFVHYFYCKCTVFELHMSRGSSLGLHNFKSYEWVCVACVYQYVSFNVACYVSAGALERHERYMRHAPACSRVLAV